MSLICNIDIYHILGRVHFFSGGMLEIIQIVVRSFDVSAKDEMIP